MNRRITNSFISLLIFLSACMQVVIPNATASPNPTETSVPYRLPVRPDFENTEDQHYTDEQIRSIKSGAFAAQEKMLIDWWQYWENAAEENRPFSSDAETIFKYFWDLDGTPGGVLLQPRGSYGNRTFYVPIQRMEYLETPLISSEIKGYSIPTGMGPLEISGDEYILAWVGNWARVDENGDVMERINIQTAQWEKLIRIEIQPDLEKVDEYPNILNKDISNGNLEASELHFYNSNKELHFSSEAFVQKIKVIEDTHIDEPLESYSYITFEDIFVYYGNKQARPVKFFSIGNYIYPSQEKISELRDFHEDIFRDPYLNLVTELWLNPSGKISRLHFVSTKSYYTESGLTAEYYEYKERDSFLAPIVKCNNCSSVCPFTNSWSSPSVFDPNIYEICEWHNEIGFDKIDKYVQEWIETGEIPDELESIPLIGTWVSW